MTFKVNIQRSTMSGISATTTMMEVLVLCTDGPVCSSVHVSNTGSAPQYTLMNFALQESECLQTSNREARSPGRARSGDVGRGFGSSGSDAVAVCERLLAFQRHSRPSKLRGLMSAARSHIPAKFNTETLQFINQRMHI